VVLLVLPTLLKLPYMQLLSQELKPLKLIPIYLPLASELVLKVKLLLFLLLLTVSEVDNQTQ